MCINLDGCQNKGGNFLNLLQKVGVPKKGGAPSEKKGIPTLEETIIYIKKLSRKFSIRRMLTL